MNHFMKIKKNQCYSLLANNTTGPVVLPVKKVSWGQGTLYSSAILKKVRKTPLPLPHRIANFGAASDLEHIWPLPVQTKSWRQRSDGWCRASMSLGWVPLLQRCGSWALQNHLSDASTLGRMSRTSFPTADESSQQGSWSSAGEQRALSHACEKVQDSGLMSFLM